MRIHGRVFNRRGDNFVDGDFKITIYEDDGTTPALLYDDDNLASLAINPFNLASDGYVDIFCDPGEYKMQVQGLGRFSRYGIVSETNLEIGAWSPDAEMYAELVGNPITYDVVTIDNEEWYPVSAAILSGHMGYSFFKDDEAISYDTDPFFVAGTDPWFTVSYSLHLGQGAGAPNSVWVGVSVSEEPLTWHRIELIAGASVLLSAVDRVQMDVGNKVSIVLRTPQGTGTVEVSRLRMVIS
jgi:hypothetical protein